VSWDDADVMYIKSLINLYYDIQDERVRVDSRVKVTKFVKCPNRHLIPYPKRKKWDGKCPICGAPAEVIEVQPPAILEDILGELKGIEKGIYAYIYKRIKENPLWKDYLRYVKGVGPILVAGLIILLHPSRFETVSKMWKYSALNVEYACPHCGYISDSPGRCPRCGMMLIGRAPKRVLGRKIYWNPTARRLCWLIGRSFQWRGGVYRGFYVMYLEKSLRNWNHRNWTVAHHIMHARRLATKIFISHWYEVGRTILGLPVRKPYIVDKSRVHKYIPPVADYTGDFRKNVLYRKYVKGILEEAGISEQEYENLIRKLNQLSRVRAETLVKNITPLRAE